MTKEIPVHGGLVALVDDEDYELVKEYSWHKGIGDSIVYARAWVRGAVPKRKIRMHQLILSVAKPMRPDHINGNGLDNRRENLRPCTNAQNACNAKKQRSAHSSNPSSAFKGVTWLKKNKRWLAQIAPNGKWIYLGCFDSETEAAQAYNKAALIHFGEFARLNVL